MAVAMVMAGAVVTAVAMAGAVVVAMVMAVAVAVAVAVVVAMAVAVVNFKEIRMIWMLLGFVSVVLFMLYQLLALRHDCYHCLLDDEDDEKK